MALVDLWRNARDQLEDKAYQQIIAFAGDGKLRDGSEAVTELRTYLSLVPSKYIGQYARECLAKSFADSGLALQEAVNQIGRRLGFTVIDGRYRGIKGSIGFDGLWKTQDYAIVVEVKTTDAYRLDLNILAQYRRLLAESNEISMGQSSILIVVGREDTGDLEAQIRGSRLAWDVRLISVEALERLMLLKEELESPEIINKIHNILVPKEFTKIDGIVDLVFSATEDIKDVAMPVDDEKPAGKKFTPVSFHAACMDRIAASLQMDFRKQSRACFVAEEADTAVLCAISREYSGVNHEGYWFAFHPHQKEFLESAESGYLGLGCGAQSQLIVIPFSVFSGWLDMMHKTELEDRFYWHIRINRRDDRFYLLFKAGCDNMDITKFLLAD